MASAMSCEAAMLVVLAAFVCDSGSGTVIVSGVGGGGVGFPECVRNSDFSTEFQQQPACVT